MSVALAASQVDQASRQSPGWCGWTTAWSVTVSSRPSAFTPLRRRGPSFRAGPLLAGEQPRPGTEALRRRRAHDGVFARVGVVGKPGAGRVAATASLALAALAAAALLVASLGSQVESVEVSPRAPTGAQPEQEREVERVSLLEHLGASVLLPLSIPVAFAALGVAAGWSARPRPLRITSAGLLLAFVIVGILSIGIYYLPARSPWSSPLPESDGPLTYEVDLERWRA